MKWAQIIIKNEYYVFPTKITFLIVFHFSNENNYKPTVNIKQKKKKIIIQFEYYIITTVGKSQKLSIIIFYN